MTQDEVIELAEAAGMTRDGEMWFSNGEFDMDVHISHLEALVNLAAYKERKKIEDHFDSMKGTEWFAENVADEIRACAEVEARGES